MFDISNGKYTDSNLFVNPPTLTNSSKMVNDSIMLSNARDHIMIINWPLLKNTIRMTTVIHKPRCISFESGIDYKVLPNLAHVEIVIPFCFHCP